MQRNIENGGKSIYLSSREYQIADLVSKGLTNIQISVETGLTVNTVKSYVRALSLKMGVNNRVQISNIFHGIKNS